MKSIRQGLAFIVSGGTATLINIAVLYALTEYGGFHYIVSAVVAFGVAFCFSFSLQKFWTFRNRRIDVLHVQAPLYLFVSLLGLLLNTGLLFVCVEVLHFWYVGAEILVAGLVAIVTFFAYKKFVFAEREIHPLHLPMFSRAEFFWYTIAALSFGLTIFIATYALSESPALWYDEGLYSQVATRVMDTGLQSLQVAPDEFVSTQYITVGYPLLYPVALSYKFFGIGAFEGRIVMAGFIVLFVVTSFFLIRKLFNLKVAVLSTFLLASFPMLYGNGKAVLGEVPGLFFLSLALLALTHLEQSGYRSFKFFGLFALAAGLCVVTKPIYLLILGGFLAAYLFRAWQIRPPLLGVVVGACVFLAALLPWAYLQFGSDISVQSIVHFYANPYSIGDIHALIGQNIVRFLTESTPMYTLVLMVVWAGSLAVRYKKERIKVAEISAFVFCILVLLAYLRLPGWYRYLFPALTIALMFLPHSLLSLLEFAKRWIPPLRVTWAPWLVWVMVGILAGAQLYQTASDSYVAGYYASTTTAHLKEILTPLGSTASFYLYNSPQVAILLPSQTYYQYLPITEHLVLGSTTLPILTEGKAEYAIVDSEAYQKEMTQFSHYAHYQTVDRYEILKKVPTEQ
jgi:putative flippase GtrA